MKKNSNEAFKSRRNWVGITDKDHKLVVDVNDGHAQIVKKFVPKPKNYALLYRDEYSKRIKNVKSARALDLYTLFLTYELQDSGSGEFVPMGNPGLKKLMADNGFKKPDRLLKELVEAGLLLKTQPEGPGWPSYYMNPVVTYRYHSHEGSQNVLWHRKKLIEKLMQTGVLDEGEYSTKYCRIALNEYLLRVYGLTLTEHKTYAAVAEHASASTEKNVLQWVNKVGGHCDEAYVRLLEDYGVLERGKTGNYYNTIKSLCEKNLLIKKGQGDYYLNPDVESTGNDKIWVTAKDEYERMKNAQQLKTLSTQAESTPQEVAAREYGKAVCMMMRARRA